MHNFPHTFKKALLENGKVSLVETNFPKNITENTLVIQLMYMGICRADVKELTGSRDIPEDRGALFGHELVGEVVFTGKHNSYEIGDIVVFNPNITPNRTTGFAEYFFVTDEIETVKRTITKMDKRLLENIWIPEPFASVIHSFDKLLELTNLENLKNKKVGVIGAGNAGSMLGMLSKDSGGEITILNRGKERINFLLDKNIFLSEELVLLEGYNKFKDFFDIVMVVPTKIEQDILETSESITKDNGIIHLYGGTRKGDVFLDTGVDIDTIRRQELAKSFSYNNKSVTLTGAYGAIEKDFIKAFQLYDKQNDRYPIQKLVSKIITLDEFPQVINGMANGEIDFPGKIVIQP